MVSESDIPIISLGRYIVDSSGNFTPDMFTSFLAVAEARIALDAPSLTGVLYDRAVGLLICHQIETGLSRTNLKSVSLGTGQTSFDTAGSSWMKEYQEILASYREGQDRASMRSKFALSGVSHSDSTMRGL